MARTHLTRQKEYELQAADSRRRWEQTHGRDNAQRPYYAHPHMVDTLGPQEDVMESRRRRKHVVMAPTRSGTKSLLAENILLLILLIGSIYGLYLLSIHILNQS